MKYLFTILALSLCVCSSSGQSCEIDGVVHSTFLDVQEILDNNNCNSCHSGQSEVGGWNYSNYDSFLKSGDCGKVMIRHGDASNSYFYQKIGGGNDNCGESNDQIHKLSPSEFSQIESWINFGAPEYCVSLYSEIKQVLNINGCNSCHIDNPQAWTYDSYMNMIDDDFEPNCDTERVIIKGNAEESFLYDKINNDGYVSCGEEMNAASGSMSYQDIAKIRDWINSGADETSSSLPVILTGFSVRNEFGDIFLRWSTEIEIGTELFVIERSQTGRDFQAIVELNAQGNSTLGHDYEVIDESPLVGDNYYRLKIIDFDGSYNYSNIKLVRVKNGETVVTVYPNPAVSRERITVKWLPQADEESTYLNIVDVNGQNLHRKIIFEGTNYVRLPSLLDGVYYIIVEDLFGGFILERVVIIN